MQLVKLTSPNFASCLRGMGPNPKSETSEKYNDRVKTFLMDLHCWSAPLSRKTYQVIDNTRNQLRLPQPGEQLRIRMQQQVNLIAIVIKAIAQHGQIDELIIGTYTLNKEAWSVIKPAVKAGKIKTLHLLLASSYSFRDADYYRALKTDCTAMTAIGLDVHLVFAWSHFKITLICAGDDYYQSEGSMNYSTNNMAENLLLENNRETWAHDRKFILESMRSTGNGALEVVC